MGMDFESPIGIIYLIFSVVSSSFLGLLTFLMLKFSAKPKLRVTVRLKKDEDKKGEPIFRKDKLILSKKEVKEKVSKGQPCTLQFYLQNVGHWYGAKPAASNVTLWANFEPAFKPRMIRYGSDLEQPNSEVRTGKGGSKYLKAEGINLFHEEAGERVEVDVIIPKKILEKKPGKEKTYSFWVAAHANEGDCGVHKFQLEII